MTNHSLLSRIKNAQSKLEVSALLAEGEQFRFVHYKTRARWQKAAAKRRKWLEEQSL